MLLFTAACQPYPDQEHLIENPGNHFYDLGKKRSLEVIDIRGDEKSVTLVFNQPLRLSTEETGFKVEASSVSLKPWVPVERTAEVGLAGLQIFFARPLPRSREVELSLSSGLRAASGASLTTPVRCHWETPRPTLLSLGVGGEEVEPRIPSRLSWNGEQDLELLFDQPVILESLKAALSLWDREDDRPLAFELLGSRQDAKGAISRGPRAFTQYRVRASEPISGEVRLRIEPGLHSTEGSLTSEIEWDVELYRAKDLLVEEFSEEGLLRFNQPVDLRTLEEFSLWLPSGSRGSWEPLDQEKSGSSEEASAFCLRPSIQEVERVRAVLLLPGLTSVAGGTLGEKNALFLSETSGEAHLPLEASQESGELPIVVLPECPEAGTEITVFGLWGGARASGKSHNIEGEVESEDENRLDNTSEKSLSPEGASEKAPEESGELEPVSVVVEVLDTHGQAVSESLLPMQPGGRIFGRLQAPTRPGDYLVRVHRDGEERLHGQAPFKVQALLPSFRHLNFQFEKEPKLGRTFSANLGFEGGSRDDYQIWARMRPAAPNGSVAPGWTRISDDAPASRSLPVKTRPESRTGMEIEIALPAHSDWAAELVVEVINTHSSETVLSRRLPVLGSVEPLKLRSFSGLPQVGEPYPVGVSTPEPQPEERVNLTGKLSFQPISANREELLEWEELKTYRTLLDDSKHSARVWELSFPEPGRYRLQVNLVGDSGFSRSAVWETLVSPQDPNQVSRPSLESISPEFEINGGSYGQFRTGQTVTLKEGSSGLLSSLTGLIAFEPIHWQSPRPPKIEVVDLLLDEKGQQELTLPSTPGWYHLRILAADLEGRQVNFQHTLTLYSAVETQVVAPLAVRPGDRFRAGLRIKVSDKSTSGVGVSASSLHKKDFEPVGFHHSSAVVEAGKTQDLLFRYQVEPSALPQDFDSEIDLGWSVTWPGQVRELEKLLPVLNMPTYGRRVARARLEQGTSFRFDVDKIHRWEINLSAQVSANKVCEFELRGPQGFLGRHLLSEEWGSSYLESGRGPGVVEVELLSGPPLRADLFSLEQEPESPRSPRLYLMRSKGERKDDLLLLRYRAVNPEPLEEELFFRLPLPGGVEPVLVTRGDQAEDRPLWWYHQGAVYFTEDSLPSGEFLYEIWTKPLAPGVYLWPAGEIADRSGISMAHSQSGSFEVD